MDPFFSDTAGTSHHLLQTKQSIPVRLSAYGRFQLEASGVITVKWYSQHGKR